MQELRERVTKLEDFVGSPQTDDALPLAVQVGRLQIGLDNAHQAQEELRQREDEHYAEANSKISDLLADVGALVETMKDRIELLEAELSLVKRAFHNGTAGAGERMQKAKVPEPKPFSGARSAKELENFLWDMAHYFEAIHTRDSEMVNLTSIYLTGDAKLWWRTRCVDGSRPEIVTWDVLVAEMKE